MKTGLTKKQKVTEVYYNAKDPSAEVYTHDTKLKRRLLEYAAKFPELCQQTDDDEQGGLRFEIDKSRISIRLTAPYSEERRKAASESAKDHIVNIKTKTRKTVGTQLWMTLFPTIPMIWRSQRKHTNCLKCGAIKLRMQKKEPALVLK